MFDTHANSQIEYYFELGEDSSKPPTDITLSSPPAKTLYFCSDNCNEPHTILQSSTEPPPVIPYPEDGLDNMRYDSISILKRKGKIEPDTDISATYMWSEKCAMKSEHSGQFKIHSRTPALYGDLVDGTKAKVLMDTGACTNIINLGFIKKHDILQSYPKSRVRGRYFHLADNSKVKVNHALTFMLYLGGHMFELTAYIIEIASTAISYDIIVGYKSMVELESLIDTRQHVVDFKTRTLPLVVTRNTFIKPKATLEFICNVPGLPPEMYHEYTKCICRMSTGLETKIFDTCKLELIHGEVNVKCTNVSNYKGLKFEEGQIIGYLDLRSIGYFTVTREAFQEDPHLKERFNFLSDEQTLQCLNFIKEMAKLPDIRNRLPAKMDKDTNMTEPDDPYPWLDKEDKRRKMTDEEILREFVNLDKSSLKPKAKESVYKTLIEFKQAFSLRDEIGTCPYMQVHLDVMDKTPFFLRPFPCKEEEKDLIDQQMRKGVLLGIMKKGMSSYSSPIMLIPRKLGGIPRIVTDLRLLNSRLVRST